jgi:hypothetical protein
VVARAAHRGADRRSCKSAAKGAGGRVAARVSIIAIIAVAIICRGVTIAIIGHVGSTIRWIIWYRRNIPISRIAIAVTVAVIRVIAAII